MKAIGCLTLASIAGCSTAAHSLGGDEAQQKIEGNGGSVGTGDSTDSGNGVGSGNGNGGAIAAPNPSPGTEAGSPSPSLPCAPCDDVMVTYGTGNFTFAGCCLPSGACGVDMGSAVSFVHGSVSSGPDATTEVALSIPPGCQPRDQVGVPDTSCPGMGVTQPTDFEGCCRSDGTCGVNLGLIHAGCVQEQRTLQQIGAYQDGGELPGLPAMQPPQTCNYSN